MTRRHLALLAVAVIAASSSGVLVRASDAPALSAAFYRNLFATAVVLPLGLVRHREAFAGLRGRDLAIAVVAGVMLALHFATWFPSLSYISVGAAMVLVTSMPIWVVLFRRLLGERASGRALAGVALSLSGALVIFGRDLGTVDVRGDALALLGAVFGAAYYVAGGEVRRRLPVLVYVSAAYAVSTIALGVAVLVAGQPFAGFPADAWLAFVALAVGPHLLGHTVFNLLLGHVRPTVIAIADSAEPVTGALLAFAAFGEVPPWTVFAGGALILAGIWVVVTERSREVAPVG